MKRSKKERQQLLIEMIEVNPFVTDEQLALEFNVSVQTIRLDRMELSIPELRERIKGVATQNYSNKLKSLPIDEVIGEIIDIELDERAISIFDVKILGSFIVSVIYLIIFLLHRRGRLVGTTYAQVHVGLFLLVVINFFLGSKLSNFHLWV